MYAVSEMMDPPGPLREPHSLNMGMTPGVAGLENRVGQFTHLGKQKMIAKRYWARHLLSNREAVQFEPPKNGP